MCPPLASGHCEYNSRLYSNVMKGQRCSLLLVVPGKTRYRAYEPLEAGCWSNVREKLWPQRVDGRS